MLPGEDLDQDRLTTPQQNGNQINVVPPCKEGDQQVVYLGNPKYKSPL